MLFLGAGIDVGKTERAVEETKQFVQDGQLLRCLICKALTHFPMPRNAFVKGGALYQLALDTHHELLPSELYKFPKYYGIHIPCTLRLNFYYTGDLGFSATFCG